MGVGSVRNNMEQAKSYNITIRKERTVRSGSASEIAGLLRHVTEGRPAVSRRERTVAMATTVVDGTIALAVVLEVDAKAHGFAVGDAA